MAELEIRSRLRVDFGTASTLRDADGPHHALLRTRFGALESDGRYTVRIASVHVDGSTRPVLAVPLMTVRMPALSGGGYAEVFERAGLAGRVRSLVFLGGCVDDHDYTWADPQAAPDVVLQAAQALLARLRDDPLEPHGIPVALFVRADGPWAGALGPSARRSLPDPGRYIVPVGSDQSELLAGFGWKIRAKYAKDAADRERLGLTWRQVAWEQACEAEGALIRNVQARHGIEEHPALLAARLLDWARLPALAPSAILVERGSSVLAVSFSLRLAETLLVYEVGLDADLGEARHACYVTAMIHAPLELARKLGCSEMDLGRAAPQPKLQRGAKQRGLTHFVL